MSNLTAEFIASNVELIRNSNVPLEFLECAGKYITLKDVLISKRVSIVVWESKVSKPGVVSLRLGVRAKVGADNRLADWKSDSERYLQLGGWVSFSSEFLSEEEFAAFTKHAGIKGDKAPLWWAEVEDDSAAFQFALTSRKEKGGAGREFLSLASVALKGLRFYGLGIKPQHDLRELDTTDAPAVGLADLVYGANSKVGAAVPAASVAVSPVAASKNGRALAGVSADLDDF